MKAKEDNKPERPEIFAIKKSKEGIAFSRKDFLGTLGVIGAGLALNPLEAMAEKIEDTGVSLSQFKAHKDLINSIWFSLDGKILASGSEDKTIKIWSIPDGKLLKTLEGHTDSVNSVYFSPDRRTLASGSMDNTIKLWSIPDGGTLSLPSACNTVCTCNTVESMYYLEKPSYVSYWYPD